MLGTIFVRKSVQKSGITFMAITFLFVIHFRSDFAGILIRSCFLVFSFVVCYRDCQAKSSIVNLSYLLHAERVGPQNSCKMKLLYVRISSKKFHTKKNIFCFRKLVFSKAIPIQNPEIGCFWNME